MFQNEQTVKGFYFDPNNIKDSMISAVNLFAEQNEMPHEAAGIIVMSMVQRALPEITNEELGLAWRTVNDTFIEPKRREFMEQQISEGPIQ